MTGSDPRRRSARYSVHLHGTTLIVKSAAPPVMLLIPNLDFGGAQRVFHDHSRLLSESFEVTEVVFNLESGNAFPTGNSLINMDVPGGGGVFDKIRNFSNRARRLRRLKRELRTRISISHLEGADYVNILSRQGEKTILCVHGSKLHDANIRGPLGFARKRLFLPALYNRADKIVVVSRDIGPELVQLGVDPSKIVTINNFFDPEAVRRKADVPLSIEERAIFSSQPVIVTSGRLAEQKNQRPLLDVFARVLEKRAAKLLFLGDGELRDEMLSHARGLGLRVFDTWSGLKLHEDYQVYFLGYQDNPFKFQKAATIFALPSAWEGFPMVLGEAMACGLPIVSADCPTGPREMLAPESGPRPNPPLQSAEWGSHGVLAPLLDRSAPLEDAISTWAGILDRLLADEAERSRLSAAAARRVEDFTRERIGRQWIQLAHDLLGT